MRMVNSTVFESNSKIRNPEDRIGVSSGNISSIEEKTSSEQASPALSSTPLQIYKSFANESHLLC